MELTEARGRVIAIGGAEDKTGERKILREFAKLAGGDKANIVVLTVATDSPKEVGAEYMEAFKGIGKHKVSVIDISSRADTDDKETLEALEQASGLFFTGGDQIHITSLIGGTEFQKVMHRRYEKGLIIAGTSAGAAMMSNSMILSGESELAPQLGSVEIGPGMDLIVGCIIDTHFSQRGRHGRLIAAVAHYPQDMGIGLDENTAMIVDKNEFTVIGEGAVTIVDGGGMSYTNVPYVEKGQGLSLSNIKVHVLAEGQRFNLHERCFIVPKEQQHKAKAKRANENESEEQNQ